jgi:HPt (histidine-containing phosphotransfer) domain-containing protein
LEKADLTYLLSMTEGNKELILEIIDIFVVQVEEFWIEMQDLLNKKDYDSLGKLAHKAKSSVAIIGMQAMSKKLRELEILCMEGKNSEKYQDVISDFKSECLIVIQELQDYKINQSTQKK